MKRRAFLLLALGVLGTGVTLGQASVAGRWKSSSGAVITIPPSRSHFDLIYHPKGGDEFVLHAAWYDGYVGRRFYYDYRGQRGVGTFDPNNPNVITVQSPNGTSTWVRL